MFFSFLESAKYALEAFDWLGMLDTQHTKHNSTSPMKALCPLLVTNHHFFFLQSHIENCLKHDKTFMTIVLFSFFLAWETKVRLFWIWVERGPSVPKQTSRAHLTVCLCVWLFTAGFSPFFLCNYSSLLSVHGLLGSLLVLTCFRTTSKHIYLTFYKVWFLCLVDCHQVT